MLLVKSNQGYRFSFVKLVPEITNSTIAADCVQRNVVLQPPTDGMVGCWLGIPAELSSPTVLLVPRYWYRR